MTQIAVKSEKTKPLRSGLEPAQADCWYSSHADTNQFLPRLGQSLPNPDRNLIVLWKSIAKSVSFMYVHLGLPPKLSMRGGF